jgi:H+-transporting ATPase
VRQLKKESHIVGATADGTGETPILRIAHIGIAICASTETEKYSMKPFMKGRGTREEECTRSFHLHLPDADIFLQAPGIYAIVAAIIESRKILQRMNYYAIYTLSTNIQQVLTFGILTIAWDFLFPPTIVVIFAFMNTPIIFHISSKVPKSQKPVVSFLICLLDCLLRYILLLV